MGCLPSRLQPKLLRYQYLSDKLPTFGGWWDSLVDKIPFSTYDFFAYLSSGTVLVVASDYISGAGLLHQHEMTPVFAVALVVFTYVCGHVAAHFSSLILEHLVLYRLLGHPASILMGEPPRWRAFAWAFPNYFRPLPAQTKARVNEHAEARGFLGRGEALFLHTYAIASSNSRIQSRLDDFRNQYGFARNISFAFMASSGALFVAFAIGRPVGLEWTVLSAIVGVTLFYRYLKFFRQHSYEVLIRYAEIGASGTSCTCGAQAE